MTIDDEQQLESRRVVYHFGAYTEYGIGHFPPKVGDVLMRDGESWTVMTVDDGTNGTVAVSLRPRAVAAR